jgi:hypothetical protein
VPEKLCSTLKAADGAAVVFAAAVMPTVKMSRIKLAVLMIRAISLLSLVAAVSSLF